MTLSFSVKQVWRSEIWMERKHPSMRTVSSSILLWARLIAICLHREQVSLFHHLSLLIHARVFHVISVRSRLEKSFEQNDCLWLEMHSCFLAFVQFLREVSLPIVHCETLARERTNELDELPCREHLSSYLICSFEKIEAGRMRVRGFVDLRWIVEDLAMGMFEWGRTHFHLHIVRHRSELLIFHGIVLIN